MTFDTTISVPTLIYLTLGVIAGIVLWVRTTAKVDATAKTVDENVKRIQQLAEVAAAANANVKLAFDKAESVRSQNAYDLSEYKLSVAKEYATNAAMSIIEERIVAAIERLGDRFDKFFDQARAPQQQRRRGGGGGGPE